MIDDYGRSDRGGNQKFLTALGKNCLSLLHLTWLSGSFYEK